MTAWWRHTPIHCIPSIASFYFMAETQICYINLNKLPGVYFFGVSSGSERSKSTTLCSWEQIEIYLIMVQYTDIQIIFQTFVIYKLTKIKIDYIVTIKQFWSYMSYFYLHQLKFTEFQQILLLTANNDDSIKRWGNYIVFVITRTAIKWILTS